MEDCSRRSCPADCNGHGACLDGVCRCNQGWSGQMCESKACIYGCVFGTCSNGNCLCDAGYEGWVPRPALPEQLQRPREL